MPDAAEIARRLSPAQRKALADAKPTGFGSLLIPPPTYLTALVLLRELCIRDDGCLTLLGLAVRAELEKQQESSDAA